MSSRRIAQSFELSRIEEQLGFGQSFIIELQPQTIKIDGRDAFNRRQALNADLEVIQLAPIKRRAVRQFGGKSNLQILPIIIANFAQALPVCAIQGVENLKEGIC